MDEVARIVGRLRERRPEEEVLPRGDSGFAREAPMAWCEDDAYLFGLARTTRLQVRIDREILHAGADAKATGGPARRLPVDDAPPLEPHAPGRRQGRTTARPTRALHEDLCRWRGDGENRIEECQLDLFADRTSTRAMRANPLRPWFASMACVLLCALRRIGLAHTRFAAATCATIRLKLLKIGARVTTGVRRLEVTMTSARPPAARMGARP